MKHLRLYIMLALVTAAFATSLYALGPELDRRYFADDTYTPPEVGEYFRSCNGHVTSSGSVTDWYVDETYGCDTFGYTCERCAYVNYTLYCAPC